MSPQKSHIAILLDGPIANDGRVRRIIHSLSQVHLVDLYYYNGASSDKKIFNQNVKLFNHSFKNSWLKKNICFNKKFGLLKETFLANNSNYNFIYCNDYPLLETSVELKKISRSKLIYDSHEIYIETINQFFPTNGWRSIYGSILIRLNKLIHFKNEQKLLKEVDLFITVCNSFLHYFKKKYGIKDGLVIRNCPDLIDFPKKSNRIKEILNLDDSTKIILYQGAINAGRGIEKIIKASNHFNEDIHFVILGSGPNLEKMKRLSFEERTSNVHFIDKVPFEDLLDYTASADAGVMLIEPINKSKELTLPNKVFEYMAAGIPVITNNLPEASEIVKHNNCGVVIEDKTPHSIANGINNFVNSIQKDSEIGMNGQHAIKKALNWKLEINKLMQNIENNEIYNLF